MYVLGLQGLQCVAIQRNNSIDQDIFLNAGEYSLSFYLQKRANFVVNPKIRK